VPASTARPSPSGHTCASTNSCCSTLTTIPPHTPPSHFVRVPFAALSASGTPNTTARRSAGTVNYSCCHAFSSNETRPHNSNDRKRAHNSDDRKRAHNNGNRYPHPHPPTPRYHHHLLVHLHLLLPWMRLSLLQCSVLLRRALMLPTVHRPLRPQQPQPQPQPPPQHRHQQR